MKKLSIAVAAIAATFVAASVAIAVTNTYSVTASTLPTKAGTKKKPVPVAVKFGYKVGEVDNKRPSPIKKYSIRLDGIVVNGKPFPKCKAAAINAAKGDTKKAGCKPGAIVGTGYADNFVGASDNENDQSLHCYLSLTIFNSPNNHAALFLKGVKNPSGAPSVAGDKYCVIDFAQAIDATYVRRGNSTALEFVVPSTVLHNVPGTDTAVREVASTIKRRTARVKGKTVAYYASAGGCKKGKRAVTVTFTPEKGLPQTAQTFAKCTA